MYAFLALALTVSTSALASEPSTCSFLVYNGSGVSPVATIDLGTGAVTVDETPLAADPIGVRGLFLTDTEAAFCLDGQLHLFDRTTGEGETPGRECDAVGFGEATVLLSRPGAPTQEFGDADEAADPEVEPDMSLKIGPARVAASAAGTLWTSWGVGNRLLARATDTWEITGKLALNRADMPVWGLFASDATLYVLDDGQGEEAWDTPAIRAYDAASGEEVHVIELDLDFGGLPRGLWCDG